MKKVILSILFTLLLLPAQAQKVEDYDTVIEFATYKAFYCQDIQTSTFCVYRLYRPAQRVSRTGFAFRAYQGLPHFNYVGTVYDKGHLVPAADRAATEREMKSTFYYINAVPQHYRLNRGSWKTLETLVRKESQKDSLLIICGGCDYSPQDSIVPRRCFKVVYSMSTKKALHADLFTNDERAIRSHCDSLLLIFPYQRVRSLLYEASESVPQTHF